MVAPSNIVFLALLSITDGRPYGSEFRNTLRPQECYKAIRAWNAKSHDLHLGRGLATLKSHAQPHTAAARAFLQDAIWEQSAQPMPGVGMDPDSIRPFERVLNDGYMPLGCIRDGMYERGDKYGANKFLYEYEHKGNVSIVHYADHVPKEDREKMTMTVCFNFCRTIPGMYAFGIVNGNDCYCTPFVKAIAGDDSTCDVVCEGDTKSMCGSTTKANVFNMHHCDNTASNLVEAADEALVFERFIAPMVEEINSTVLGTMQGAGEHLQNLFGQAGDPTASDLLQNVKVFAGKLESVTTAASEMPHKVMSMRAEVIRFNGNPFTESKAVTDAEALTKRLKDSVPEAHKYADEAHRMFMLTQRGKEDEHLLAGRQYYSLMYFVDKELQTERTTCGGDFDLNPLFSTTPDACAAACDDDRECVGFSFYDVDDVGTTCFLAYRFKTVNVYTKCHEDGTGGNAVDAHVDFVQKLQRGSFLRPRHRTGVDATAADALSAHRQRSEDRADDVARDFSSRMASIFSARKKKSSLGGDGWKADYEDIGQGYGAGPGEAFLKSCTTHEVTREKCAEMCSAWDNCQGFSQGHDHPGLSNTCIIFPAVGERDNCPEDGEDHAWEKFFHGDDEELVETFMGDDMDHMPVPFHTYKKAKHDQDSGPELHAGCRCDEEFFEPTQTCYKKCAILTEGAFANRSGTNSCCRGEPCHAGGHQHTSGFGCEGFGVDGDGNCPSRPSLARVDSKVCEKPAPEQLPLPPLRPSVQVKRSKDDHATRVEDGLEVPAAEDEPTGSLAKLVDHALANHHDTEGKGHGLVMCFAKFSKFEGTKPAVKVKKFNRCYTASAEEGEAEGEEE